VKLIIVSLSIVPENLDNIVPRDFSPIDWTHSLTTVEGLLYAIVAAHMPTAQYDVVLVLLTRHTHHLALPILEFQCNVVSIVHHDRLGRGLALKFDSRLQVFTFNLDVRDLDLATTERSDSFLIFRSEFIILSLEVVYNSGVALVISSHLFHLGLQGRD
jgi:hypothetical protein